MTQILRHTPRVFHCFFKCPNFLKKGFHKCHIKMSLANKLKGATRLDLDLVLICDHDKQSHFRLSSAHFWVFGKVSAQNDHKNCYFILLINVFNKLDLFTLKDFRCKMKISSWNLLCHSSSDRKTKIPFKTSNGTLLRIFNTIHVILFNF